MNKILIIQGFVTRHLKFSVRFYAMQARMDEEEEGAWNVNWLTRRIFSFKQKNTTFPIHANVWTKYSSSLFNSIQPEFITKKFLPNKISQSEIERIKLKMKRWISF